MPLLDSLQRILDLEEPFEEAHKKLVNTYMIVNNTRVLKVLRFYELYNSIACECLETKKEIEVVVDKLDAFLPKSGVYRLKNQSLIKITKYPIRQWLRSFSPSFYKIAWVDKIHKDFNDNYLSEIINQEPLGVYVTSFGVVEYNNIKIGKILANKNIECTNLNFKQEIIDWNNYAQ